MEIITFESNAFKELEKKIDRIARLVANIDSTPKNNDPDLSNIRLETEEICDILNISSRTLQRIRKEGRLFYYIEKGKCIYKFEDVERLLAEKIFPTHIKSVQEFRKAYLEYVKQAI